MYVMRAFQLLSIVSARQANEASGTTDVRADIRAEFSSASEMLTSMQSRLDASEQRASSADKALEESNEKIKDLQGKDTQLSQSVQKEQADNDKWHEVADDLQDKVQNGVRDLAVAKTKLAAAEKRAKTPAANPYFTTLAQTGEAKRQEKLAAEARRSEQAAEAKADQMNQLAQSRAQKITAIEAKVNATQDQKLEISRTLKARLTDLSEEEDELSKLKGELSHLKQKVGSQSMDLSRSEHALADAGKAEQEASKAAESALRALHAKSAALQNATLLQIQAHVAEAKAESEAQQTRHALMARLTEVDALQTDTTTLRKKLAEVTAENGREKRSEKMWRAEEKQVEKTMQTRAEKAEAQVAAAKADAAAAVKEEKAAQKLGNDAEDRAAKAVHIAEQARRVAASADQDRKDALAAADASAARSKESAAKAQATVDKLEQLQQELSFNTGSNENLQATLDKANEEINGTKQQVALLQRRGQALEQLQAQQQFNNRQADTDLANAKNDNEGLQHKYEILQSANQALNASLTRMTSQKRQAESSENEYFDSMTALQSQKDDLAATLQKQQDGAKKATAKAEELTRTNEYLRDESKSADAAQQAAMSDYLREIEGLRAEETRDHATIASDQANIGKMHEAVTSIWNMLTPDQKAKLEHKNKPGVPHIAAIQANSKTAGKIAKATVTKATVSKAPATKLRASAKHA